jgi:D-serine deaminase-like pyridoxal phosphate-dependent protein
LTDATDPSERDASAGPASPRPGTPIEALETPFLLVDLGRFERNVAAWPEAIGQTGARLRPHIKTHKAPALGQVQIAAGSSSTEGRT